MKQMITLTQAEMDRAFREAQNIRARVLDIQGKLEEAAAVRRLQPPIYQFQAVIVYQL